MTAGPPGRLRRLRRSLGEPDMRRLGQRSAWTLAGTAITTVAVFAETVILARHLGPEAFGLFLLVLAFPEAVLGVLDLRVKDAMNKYLSEALVGERTGEAVALLKLFWLLDLAVGAICLVIVVAIAGPMAELLTGDDFYGHLMALYAIGLLIGTLDTASGSVLRVLDRFDLAFFTGAASIVVRLGLVVSAVATDGDLEALVWARNGAEVATTLIVGTVSFVVLKEILWADRRTPMSALGERRREVLRFLVSTNLTATLKVASTKLDTMLVGILATPATVAIYRFALQFARAPLLLSDALYTAVFPTFARAAAEGSRLEIRRIARTSTATLCLTLLPASLICALLGSQVLGLVGGGRYEDGGLAFAICLVGVLPYALLFWLRPLILTAGHAGALLRIQAMATATQLVSILAFVPMLNAEGAAISIALANLLAVVLQFRLSRQRRLLEVQAHA